MTKIFQKKDTFQKLIAKVEERIKLAPQEKSAIFANLKKSIAEPIALIITATNENPERMKIVDDKNAPNDTYKS